MEQEENRKMLKTETKFLWSVVVLAGTLQGCFQSTFTTATSANGSNGSNGGGSTVITIVWPTPIPATVPSAPTIGTPVANSNSASVLFTAPGSNGGSPILSYTVTSTPGNFTGTGSTSPITVAGLTNGIPYIFTVTATNAVGTGVASSASISVTPEPSVITLAGTAGVIGSVDATGAAASFHYPESVAVDSSGNVYVADTNNHTIRKITSSGVVTTLAGQAGIHGSTNATGTAASFYSPAAVAVDVSGNVYVVDTGNYTIRMITPAGVVTTIAGTAGTSGCVAGTGAAARFGQSEGIAVDNLGNLYVADPGCQSIWKIAPGAVVTRLAGSTGALSGSTDGTGTTARFYNPQGIAVDSLGNLYVADSSNFTIRKITSAGVVTTLAGTAGFSGSTNATGAAASFNDPIGVAVDSSGNLYVGDTFNHTIRKITPVGVVTTFAGATASNGSTDGIATAARFNEPEGVAVDSSGNVYVADFGNHTIRKIH